ncbi:hypothetical protein ACCC84_04630 [Serratia odorifera]|uniref:hypothetical protein n=1 Tax=Serratia odorifera TaxID=618 RepID=UPI00353235B9
MKIYLALKNIKDIKYPPLKKRLNRWRHTCISQGNLATFSVILSAITYGKNCSPLTIRHEELIFNPPFIVAIVYITSSPMAQNITIITMLKKT